MTNVNLVAREVFPVDVLIVELEKDPVACEPVRPVRIDGIGVENKADDALVRVRPGFTNLVVKLVQVFDGPGRNLYSPLLPLAGFGHRRIIAMREVVEPGDRLPPIPD